MYLDPTKLETVAFALAEAHYAHRFNKDPKDPHVQSNARSNWNIFLEIAIISVTAWENMRNDNDN